ncbi:SDR family NAD(P)-dependent oxidoreductase [Arthrobacter sp. JZ12]|uniref:SDR family NAD(P)-dependent oxidoreductase n=1 Tax=Arthrobacter sp. JZ12 TaxID=2654190 RepID=UPI002B45D49C|nr:SDR family NAD(P)-dependent oxidoreductase [Arthrobacter sp. JZ12]
MKRPIQYKRPNGTEGDVVVITGASSGIGRDTALAFARQGARLALASRSAENLQPVLEECIRLGAQAIARATDVRDEQQVAALMAAAAGTFGHIDICVINASVYSYGTFEATPSEVFRSIIETNLLGAANTARQALPHLRRQGSGTLIFIGSVYSRITSPYVSPYVASKFGLYGMVRVLRQELRRDRGIRICLVLPATIDTPIYQHAANYTGRNVHPLPPVVHPDRVVDAIIANARNPRATTVVGVVQRTFIPFHALLPGLYDRLVGPLMRIAAIRRGRAAPTTGTVLSPAPHAGPVTGGWGKLGRPDQSPPPDLDDQPNPGPGNQQDQESTG